MTTMTMRIMTTTTMMTKTPERMTMSRVNLRDLIETGSFCKDIKGINDTDYDDDNKNDKGILNRELDRDLVSSVIHFQNSKLKPI